MTFDIRHVRISTLRYERMIILATTSTRCLPPPHHSFPLFLGPLGAAFGSPYRLDYVGHHNQFFPIGHIGDKREGAITTDQGRTTVEEAFGSKYSPIIHLALGHEKHNIVHVLDEVPRKHLTLVADAVIVRKPERSIRSKPIAIGTLLGDCPVVCVTSDEWLGFVHCGRPEAMDEPSVIEVFLTTWPSPTEETEIYVGPGICGRHYGLKTLDEKYNPYKTECPFEGEVGFDLAQFILATIADINSDLVCNTVNNGTCPYCQREAGEEAWASDQWFKRNRSGEFSPRDWAAFIYNPTQ